MADTPLVAPVVRVHARPDRRSFYTAADPDRTFLAEDDVVGQLRDGDLAVLLRADIPLPPHLSALAPSSALCATSRRLIRPMLWRAGPEWEVPRYHGTVRVMSVPSAHLVTHGYGRTHDVAEGECAGAILGLAAPTAPAAAMPPQAARPVCRVVRVQGGANPNRDPLQDWRRGPIYMADCKTVGKLKPGGLAVLIAAGTRLPPLWHALLEGVQDGVMRHTTLFAPGRGSWLRPGLTRMESLAIFPPGDNARAHLVTEGHCVASILGASRDDASFTPNLPVTPAAPRGPDWHNMLRQLLARAPILAASADSPITGTPEAPQLRFDGIEIYQNGRDITPALTFKGQVVYRFNPHPVAPGATLQLPHVAGAIALSRP